VVTVELNYGDDPADPYVNEDNRRYGQLAWLLRSHTLVDVTSYNLCQGQPVAPGQVHDEIVRLLSPAPTSHAAK